ncbi:MAG: CPBP family intramembrane glutamic endopeptidase [Alphaproteobacteria bacterium]
MTDERKKALLAFAALSWPFYLNDFYLIPLSGRQGAIGLLWVLDVIFYTLVPCITLAVLYRKGQLDFLKPALALPRGKWLLATVAGAVVLAFATHHVFTRGLDHVFMSMGCCRQCQGYPLPLDALAALLVTVYAPLSAGILEEVIFRGVLIDLLKKYTVKPAILIVSSAAIFAAIHWCGGSGKLLATFTIGLIPAALYLRTGNLWLPMLWHVLHDGVVFYKGWG